MAYDGWWSLDSEQSGFEKMEAGLNGPARDFARFGQLFLQNGEWNGEQVLPPAWVQESTSVDPATQNETYYAHAWGPDVYDDGRGYYKYMWYGFFRGGDAGGYDFAALGDHGQIIYVAPSKNLVIVRHGTSYGDLPSDRSWTDMLYQFVSDWEE
jgi:CubicO group peptidase (beta-lactamase class C family)